MADPAGLSAAVLVEELCALGYSYPNFKYYTKKEVFAAFRVIKRGRNRTKTGIFWPNMAEEGGTGAKPARGTHGLRVVPAARPESAPYRRLDVGSDTPLAALLTLPRQWTYPPRPAGTTRSAMERRPYRKNKKQLEPKF